MTTESNTPRKFSPPTHGQIIEVQDRRYVLGKTLGEGYFGHVYECWDDWGNELVAKILLPKNRTYEEVQQQWRDELNKLAGLRHPNITFVYDALEYQDTFYLILERCSYTLKNLIVAPNLNGEIWLPYVSQAILQALHFMHRAGYVHKDLHSGNVFVAWTKDKMVPTKDAVIQFKVGDLGITRLESDINVFGTILADWMRPPESIDPSEFGLLGRQVDIYHTGLLLLSLLLRREPTFTHQEVLDGKPRELAESLPSKFSPVVAKALRRHVESRYQSALEMWREIAAINRAA